MSREGSINGINSSNKNKVDLNFKFESLDDCINEHLNFLSISHRLTDKKTNVEKVMKI